MPAINNAQNYGRTFTIGRETDDKASRPHFFEWVKEKPAETTKGAKYRTKTSTKGVVRHYRLWQGWSGHLVGLETEMKTYGSGIPERVLVATLDDSEEIVKIELAFYESYAGDLMKRLLDDNFDTSESLSLSPFAMDKASGKGQNIGISATSGADTTLTARTRDFGEGENRKEASPHLVGIPDLDKGFSKGKETYDNTRQSDWLWEQLLQKVVPRLSSLGGAAPVRQTVPHTQQPSAYRDDYHFPEAQTGGRQEPEMPSTKAENDDLPF